MRDTGDQQIDTEGDGSYLFKTQATDILMPERDGIEVIRELRRKFPAVAIIAMSGAEVPRRELYLEAGMAFGADAVLEKPFDKEELFISIEKALKRKGSP